MTSLAMTVGSFTAKSMSGTNGSPYAGALASMFGPSSVNGGCTSMMLGGSVIAFVGIVFLLIVLQCGFQHLNPDDDEQDDCDDPCRSRCIRPSGRWHEHADGGQEQQHPVENYQ